ncbi:hypothetical protein [Paenarthrobacter ilicis]|uniref:hypothetical protein n=1 Tax=Paenarthrobacter ilicis TaxID=43665 RepID=UPI003870537D
MTSPGYRRPFTVAAAVIAVLSLAAVGVVIAISSSGATPPTWVTSVALYGLPLAFVLAAVPVLDAIRQRRKQ